MIMESNTDGQESEIMNNIDRSIPSKECSSELKKSCMDCHTTTTPCWRVGPAGPKTLCNACGIRYRKRRRAVLGLDKGGAGRSSRKIGESGGSKLGISSLKLGLMVAGGRYMLLEEEWKMKKKKKLGEEEQAAILLMALSCSC